MKFHKYSFLNWLSVMTTYDWRVLGFDLLTKDQKILKISDRFFDTRAEAYADALMRALKFSKLHNCYSIRLHIIERIPIEDVAKAASSL